jgi:GNAT superfamily N-acetyltransferase
VKADPAAPDAAGLIAELDAEFHQRYPGEPVFGIDASAFVAGGGVFLIAYLAGVPAGCGAVRPIDDGVVEVKRMFVRPAARGHGIARALLTALEAIAIERGYTTSRLETGLRQPEAIGLYESFGYHRVPCWGEYAASPHSICYEKSLTRPS